MLGSDKEHQANSQHQAKLDILVGYFSHVIKKLQDFNPIRTFFKRPFFHEQRGLEVPNLVTFPNSL